MNTDPSRMVHLDFNGALAVRCYPSLDDPSTYDHATYRIGALMSDADGVSVLALERTTDDGRTEVIHIRLRPARPSLTETPAHRRIADLH